MRISVTVSILLLLGLLKYYNIVIRLLINSQNNERKVKVNILCVT